MTRTSKLTLPAIALTALLTACHGGFDEQDTIDRGERVAVRFNQTLDIGIDTRATDDAFEAGDALSLFVVNRSATQADTLAGQAEDYAYNTQYVSNGAGFLSQGEPIWQYTDLPLDLVYYAVYPYEAGREHTFSFGVQTDQTTHAAYTASDLAWQKVASRQANVSLALSHMLSQIEIVLRGADDEDLRDYDISVTLNNMAWLVTADLNRQTVTTSTEATPVSIGCENHSNSSTIRRYHAIVAPQRLVQGTSQLATITVGEQSFSMTMPVTRNLTSGKLLRLYYDVESDFTDGAIYIRYGGVEEGGHHVD